MKRVIKFRGKRLDNGCIIIKLEKPRKENKGNLREISYNP